jgi:hypothetical protein
LPVFSEEGILHEWSGVFAKKRYAYQYSTPIDFELCDYAGIPQNGRTDFQFMNTYPFGLDGIDDQNSGTYTPYFDDIPISPSKAEFVRRQYIGRETIYLAGQFDVELVGSWDNKSSCRDLFFGRTRVARAAI